MNKIVLLLFLLYSIGSTSQENYETLRIPIVFHVIDHSIKDGDIPDQEFEKLVQLLNRNFSEPNSTYISPIYFPKARNTKIKFYIPSKTKNCEIIDPITWTHTNQKHYKFNDDFPLIDVHQPRLENKNFLNVYLVRIGSEKGSINGYYKSSTSLGEEGIVLDWTLLYRPQENLYGQPNSVTQGVKTLNPMAFALSHEIGHFFNLKHTWGAKAILFNGCNHQTQYVFGDFVDDTPPQPGPNEAYKKNRFNPTNKLWSPLPNCGTSTPSNYQNFMDYGYGAPNGFGMFTEGQVIRMRDYIDNKKQSLIWKENCKEAPSPTTGFFKDNRNNKSYKWVQIGSQKWMTKNLNYKTENSICYNNNESNCTIYGRLYNWNEAMTACPDGWRLPKTQDWKQMAESVSYNLSTIKSSEGWIKDNGSNYRELNILPSGYYNVTRRFRGLGQRASFWLADDLGNNVNRNSRTIRDGFNQIPTSGINFAREKLSCRCIQDIIATSQQLPSNNDPILKKTKLDKKAFYSFMIKTLNLEYKEDKFLKEYLQRTRKLNPKNEFEKQRLLSEVKSEITRNISQFNYHNKFYLDYNTSLGEYSFDSKKFTLKLPKTLYDIGYYHLFDDFKIIGRDASSYGGFEMYAANFKDFKEIPISENEAENFLNKFSNRRIYCTIEFSLLKTPLMGTGMGRNKVVGMFGHISKVYLYSDKEKTKLVKTLNFKKSKGYFENFKYGMFYKESTFSSKIDFSFFNN